MLTHLASALLTPERVQAIVSEVAARRAAGNGQAVTSLRQLRDQHSKTRKKIANLMRALAEGVITSSDIFKETMQQTEAEANQLRNLIATQEKLLASRPRTISLEEAKPLVEQLREKLLMGAPALQKRVIRSFIKHVVVSNDGILIVGANSDLTEVVTGSMKW